jgi:hypothetical protein
MCALAGNIRPASCRRALCDSMTGLCGFSGLAVSTVRYDAAAAPASSSTRSESSLLAGSKIRASTGSRNTTSPPLARPRPSTSNPRDRASSRHPIRDEVIGSGPPGAVTSRPRSSSPCPAASRCRAAAFKSSSAGLVGQPVQAPPGKPSPPPGHGSLGHAQLRRDGLVVLALSAGQHDLRPQRQRLRARRPPRPPGQLIPLLPGQLQPRFRAA